MSDDSFEEFGLYPSTTRKIFQEDVQSALDVLDLDKKDVEIISFRFGLPGLNFQPPSAVSKKYDVTREYINQLELKVFREVKKLYGQ